MTHEHVTRVQPKETANSQEVQETVVEDNDAGLLSDIDDLLDEIDAVLEDQSALVDFRQRSGQ